MAASALAIGVERSVLTTEKRSSWLPGFAQFPGNAFRTAAPTGHSVDITTKHMWASARGEQAPEQFATGKRSLSEGNSSIAKTCRRRW
jgi:hypothetical protein